MVFDLLGDYQNYFGFDNGEMNVFGVLVGNLFIRVE